MEFFETFLKAFVPMFVAVDIVGVTPFFIGITEGMEAASKKKLIVQSVLTATIIAILFVFVGQALFDFLKIEMMDFLIAGGAVLFIISTHDLISKEKSRVMADPSAGVVPLGTPLLAGPAVLATAITIVKPYGIAITLLAIISNFLIAGAAFFFSKFIIKLIGNAGARALSKIMALILAAYGIMMIRQGIVHLIEIVR